MLSVNYTNPLQIAEQPLIFAVAPDPELEALGAKLSPETSWGERKHAAERLGRLRNQAAVPYLLAALPTDPFWMVRNAIIQALIQIGSPDAIPTLQWVAVNDRFQVVRSYAMRAITALSA